MLTALSGCATLPEGAAKARLDAVAPHIRPCAGALAGEAMPAAREACLPVLARLVE